MAVEKISFPSFFCHPFFHSVHACITFRTHCLSGSVLRSQGLKWAVSEDYCPAWRMKANHNISCNYFNSTRCNMLWSVEKGVINCLQNCNFFFAKINGTNINLYVCCVYMHIVRM